MAREQLQASLAREPDAAASMAALGEVMAHAGSMGEARRWARSAEQAARGLPRLEQLRMAAFRAGLEYRWDDALASLQALSKLNPGDAESGQRLVEAELASGRLQSAQHSLEQLSSIKTPSLDRYRLEMLGARLAAARGDHVARLAAANAATDLADNDSQRIDAGLEKAWALLLQGAKDEARSALELADSALGHDSVTLQQIKLAMLRSTLQRESGEYPAAMSGFVQAAKDAAALGQDSLSAAAKREAAYVQVQAGDPGAAVKALDQVIDDLQQHGDVRELASAQDVLSLAQQSAGNPAAAQLAGKAALDAYIRVGDRAGEASARNQIGMLYARAGRSDEAREHFEKAQRIFATQGNRRGAATALSNLAILHGRAGKAEAAREAEEAALVEFREIGALPEVARLQFNMAVRDRAVGRLEDADKRFREALDAFVRIGAGDFARQATASLAELLMLRADLAGAEAILERQPDTASAGVLPRTALMTARARLALLRGDFESAESRYREARVLRDKAGLGDWARMSDLDLAEMNAARGRWELAEHSARKQRREMHAAKDNVAALQAGVLVAASLCAQGSKAAAERLLETLDAELTKHPDALQSLRIDLVRADMRSTHRSLALQQVADSARSKGYEMLALRAELLADDDVASTARVELERRGVKLPNAAVLLLD